MVLFTGKIFSPVLIGLTAGGGEKIELLMTAVTSSRADSIILELTTSRHLIHLSQSVFIENANETLITMRLERYNNVHFRYLIPEVTHPPDAVADNDDRMCGVEGDVVESSLSPDHIPSYSS